MKVGPARPAARHRPCDSAHGRSLDPARRGALRAARPRAVVVALILLLGACGQKGPLYLPGHSKDTPWPLRPDNPKPTADANAPAGDASGKSQNSGATSGADAGPTPTGATPMTGTPTTGTPMTGTPTTGTPTTGTPTTGTPAAAAPVAGPAPGSQAQP